MAEDVPLDEKIRWLLSPRIEVRSPVKGFDAVAKLQ